MLSCREVVELITEYLEGAGSSEQRIGVERHVAICPPCRGFLGQVRHSIAVSAELPDASISPEVRDALVETFQTWSKSR